MTANPGPAANGPADARPDLDLVFAGNLIVDDLVFPDGRTRMGQAGGAMLYAALGASLWGARVGIVSVAGNDYPSATFPSLESHGVDITGIRRLDHPGLRTWLLYERTGRRVVHHLDSPSHHEVSPLPEQLPERYRNARAFHLSPMPLDRQRAWVEHLAERGDAFVSIDPHESVREDNLAAWHFVLSRVDACFFGEDELKLGEVERDPRATLKRLGAGRLKLAAYKQGTRGGLLHERTLDRFHEWSGAHPPVVDPTGAGDAFAGGFLAGFLSTGKVEPALEQGAVAASFAIENWGARGLLSASRETADHRRHVWFGGRVGA